MRRFKYPSYWLQNRSCPQCGRSVGRLVRWVSSEKEYIVRMVQPHCTHVGDQSIYRNISQVDVDEYLKRYNAGEESQ